MTYEELARSVIGQIEKSVIGKHEVVEKVFCALLAKGHILIEDIPGLGKTTMAMAFARAMSLDAARMQFTPDVLPSDIVGFHMYDKQSGEMKFQKGAVFCNLFLADEINRTSPKSQSALLEVMEESKVTVDGETHVLEQPFMVIATQNPAGSAGTQLLPESQMDRFMIRLSMGYPSAADELSILKSKREASDLEEAPILSKQRLIQMQEIVERVYIHDMIYKYIVALVQATREHPLLELGASPRAGVSLCRMASAYAFLQGRDYVIPEDIVSIFADVTDHRVILSPMARMKHVSKEEILQEIMEQVVKPRITSSRQS